MIAMLKAKSISKAKEINIGSIGVMFETFSSIPFVYVEQSIVII